MASWPTHRRWRLPSIWGHAQFETIHPFSDGNGRVGRALAQAMLRHRGVTQTVVVPVSAGMLADAEGYHAALTAYRAGDVDPIIHSFAAVSLRAVHNARQLVAEIEEIRKSWNSRLNVRSNSNAWKILDVLTRRPVLNSSAAARPSEDSFREGTLPGQKRRVQRPSAMLGCREGSC